MLREASRWTLVFFSILSFHAMALPDQARALPSSPIPGGTSQPEAALPEIEKDRADPFLDGPTLDRDLLVAAVLERNPGIAAARAAWRAALEEVPQAKALEDPTASYSLAPLSIASDDTRFGDQLRLGQRLPFPGTLRLRGEVAEAEAAAAEQRVEEVRLRLAAMAALLWDDYWLVGRSLAITDEHIALLESFQQVATSRYSVGLAAQQAPIQAEVEAAHLLHQRVVFETERRTLAARLNALLHREPRAPLPPAGNLEVTAFAAPVPEQISEAALAERPEVQAQQAEIESRRAAVELSKLGFRPGFEAMASYNSMWGMPEHRWMLGVGVSLPIWRDRVRAEVAQAEARLDASESELARLEDQVQEQIEIALAELERARHVMRLYEDRVLPAARDQVAAARAGFETSANTMLALIDAERSLRTAQLNYFQAIADAASWHAELARATGHLPAGLTEPMDGRLSDEEER